MSFIVSVLQYIFLLFIFIASSLVLHFFIKSWTKSEAKNPPSPPSLPIIGHLHMLSSNLPKSLETLARRYGPLMKINIGSTPHVVASHASIAKEILKTQDVDFASKFAVGPTHYNIYRGTEFINAPYGTYWRFMKKLCMTKLFAGPQLERFSHIRNEEIKKLLLSLMKCSEEGRFCDLRVELPALTNNMICRMAMRKSCSKYVNQAKEIREAVRTIMELGAKMSFFEVFGPLKKFDIFGKGRKLEAAIWKYDQLLEQIMKDYEENDINIKGEGEKDVMDILLETSRDTKADVKLTRSHIKHFFLDIFMASVDTTSASTQWAMIELINRPKLFKRLREEIDRVVGLSRLVTESDLPNLPYLRAFLKENLRIHPAGTLLRRKCNQDCMINGYNIKAGTNIMINAYMIMNDPDVWKNPEELLPERFLEDQHQLQTKDQDFNYLPFGAGRRACIGASHASIVMHTTVGALVQCFDWKMKEEKVDVKTVNGYSGAMAQPLLCYPITRLNPL